MRGGLGRSGVLPVCGGGTQAEPTEWLQCACSHSGLRSVCGPQACTRVVRSGSAAIRLTAGGLTVHTASDVLRCAGNSLGDAGAAALAPALRTMSQLTSLNLAGTDRARTAAHARMCAL